ncbi:MAG: hypothetical protein JW900_09665 [Anaerolineae bacterium]|nr:hypothetical protein [Anaerolineae bacterium]
MNPKFNLLTEEASDARDLRNTLLIGALTILVFGIMLLGTESGTGVLEIPTLETSLIALLAAFVTAGGLIALRLGRPARPTAWAALLGYTLVVTLMVHFTGGPLTPVPALYLLVVVAASFLLGKNGATLIAVLSAFCYALILFLEYSELLSMVLIWRQEFNPRERGVLLVINWLAVAVPALFTAQLAGTLAERLKTTNAHLRQSEQMRENMTEMIVHDLRNPLTSMIGGLEILRMTLGEQLDVERTNLLDNARRSGQLLLGMVEEMLTVSKMEAEAFKLNLEPLDLHALIAECAEPMRMLAEMEDLAIELELGENVGVVRCDRKLVSRVVTNLLSNALKYTPAGGNIRVTLGRAGGLVTVCVADNGIGIPVENQERIFDKFGVSTPDDRHGRRGTGLGLAFCRMAVEIHGGRIWVESAVGEGSSFFFTLPVDGPAGE